MSHNGRRAFQTDSLFYPRPPILLSDERHCTRTDHMHLCQCRLAQEAVRHVVRPSHLYNAKVVYGLRYLAGSLRLQILKARSQNLIPMEVLAGQLSERAKIRVRM